MGSSYPLYHKCNLWSSKKRFYLFSPKHKIVPVLVSNGMTHLLEHRIGTSIKNLFSTTCWQNSTLNKWRLSLLLKNQVGKSYYFFRII